MKHRILAVITARGGSKGIPKKNIKLLGNKPLIAYSIETAQQSQLISHLIVSTDSEEIAAIAREHNAEVPFLRPIELATDTARHIEVMQHAIIFMEKSLNIVFDYIVILQPTSPFRLVEDIDLTLQKLIDSGADSALTMVEISGGAHPIKAKRMEGERILPYFDIQTQEEGLRRQDFPVVFKRSSAVFSMRRDLLMLEGKIYGSTSVGHIVPQERSIDIDDEFDWLKAEYMLKRLRQKGLFL
jgi:CMP-N,N'-diacetyllegionaminic acid synthase